MVEQIEVGKYYARNDNKGFNPKRETGKKKQMALFVETLDTHSSGILVANGAYAIFPEDLIEITKEEYDQKVEEHRLLIEKAKEGQLKADEEKYKKFGLKEGDWIRKANWGPIGNEVVLQVKHFVKSPTEKEKVIVNNKYAFHPSNYVVLSAEEAQTLKNEFNNLKIAEPIHGMPRETMCLRDDTKEPKVRYELNNEKKALMLLFEIKHKNPDKPFELYKCDYCHGLHIGKRPSQQTINAHRLKMEFTLNKKKNLFQRFLSLFKRNK